MAVTIPSGAKRQANAAELDQLRALEKQKPSSSGGGASWNGVDALTSVGGMFSGSGAGARCVEDIAASTAETEAAARFRAMPSARVTAPASTPSEAMSVALALTLTRSGRRTTPLRSRVYVPAVSPS